MGTDSEKKNWSQFQTDYNYCVHVKEKYSILVLNLLELCAIQAAWFFCVDVQNSRLSRLKTSRNADLKCT